MEVSVIPEGHWEWGVAVVTGELQNHFQRWLWGVRAHPSFTPALFTQQQRLRSAWGLDLDHLQSPSCSPRCPHSLSLFRMQMADGVSFLVSRSSH